MKNDEPVAGKLAMVVRGNPCCGRLKTFRFGQVFMVERIDTFANSTGFSCASCGTYMGTSIKAACTSAGIAAPIYLLKRIDPPAEEETRQQTTELCAS